MFERILESDPLTGVTELFRYDDISKRCIIETTQNVAPLLENNRMQYNNFDQRARWNRNQNLVAQIPGILYAEMMQSGLAWDQKGLRRWLDDPDNLLFRTRPGLLSR